MAFNYRYSGNRRLAAAAEQLLEEIYNYQYAELQPYKSLGEIHDSLMEVEIVDHIPGRLYYNFVTIEEIRAALESIRERNEELKKQKEAEMEEMRSSEDWFAEGYLNRKVDTEILENALKEAGKGGSESKGVVIPFTNERMGYYTRVNGKGKIVLLNQRNEWLMAMTYVHELMHAYFDCECKKRMNDVEFIEEPLAEFGMLKFMSQFHSTNPRCEKLFKFCYYQSRKQQDIIGEMHYGFGVELWDVYPDIDWIGMLRARHTMDKNLLDSQRKKLYSELEKLLWLSWPNEDGRYKAALDIYMILQKGRIYANKNNDACLGKRPNMKNIWGYQWLFRWIIDACCYDDLYIGDVLEIDWRERCLRKYGTKNNHFLMHDDYYFSEILPYLDSLKYENCKPLNMPAIFFRVLRFIPDYAGYFELECLVNRSIIIPCVLVSDNMTAISVPKTCETVHFLCPFRYLKEINVDSNNPYFYCDRQHQILVDKRNSKLILGINNTTIPDGIKVIGDRAFYDNRVMKSLKMPDSVEVIEEYAFGLCHELQSVDFNKVTRIAYGAFFGCHNLKDIYIPESVVFVGDQVFRGCSNINTIVVDPKNKVFDSRNDCNAIIETKTCKLVHGCKNSTIPDGVKRIGYRVFERINTLKSLKMPDSVEVIEGKAFEDCCELLTVDFNKVTKIGDEAFRNCSKLKYIYIPGSVTFVGKQVFYGCSNVSKIVVDPTNKVCDSRDNCNAIIRTELNLLIKGCINTVIPNSVKTIGVSAFYKCNMKSISLPEGVETIAEDAFGECEELESVTLPKSITSIGQCAFWGCCNLKSIMVPQGMKDYFAKMLGDEWAEHLVER